MPTSRIVIPTPWPVRGPTRAFHVSAAARRRFGIDEAWVTLRGVVVLARADRAATIAERVTAAGLPPLRAADLLAGALLDEVYHVVIAHYLANVDAMALTRAMERARASLGGEVERTLRAFVAHYPPPDVADGDPLARVVDGVSGAEVALEELWTCYLANANPALAAAQPLVDLAPLAAVAPIDPLLAALQGHLSTLPGPEGRVDVSLFDLLLEPLRRHPHDLAKQLGFVRERWGVALGHEFVAFVGRLQGVLAEAREAEVRRQAGPGPAPAPSDVRAGIAVGGGEVERFSRDDDWMPRVVMIAKSTHVWLDQLTRSYAVPIARLDDVPDAEFAALAERGVNALWLIGLWQRSAASQTIKRLRGASDALASAYALDDYAIATELGGEGAYAALVERAARFGVRIATDMVPNHVGIDGRWVIDHPERFVQLPTPPYPAYRFTGPDLSPDPRVEIRIEDHYYDASDAAVVFERRDVATGEVRYLYHGNDGTLTPWNDTAQLDYLRADVREAVIATILAVARRSPIIRFDAAMTLAKRHVRRLWYPEPGEPGGVPSRGRWGALSEEAFEAAMPVEFWREVVDRVAVEAPGTLLLAEAFWMMEGYFVRTLGMHRVYNSAFMHMLRDHDDAGYRAIVKEILLFDPRILQRFVNFMNNPDEETAREQFGDGDRYFAVATLLSTLPGLPLFGHGQFEGFTEKYGMEFSRARRSEVPDARLLERHARSIAPLLRRRGDFSAVDGFRLFDALGRDGAVIEGVYAFVNRSAGGTSLVLVNHQPTAAQGRLLTSAPQVVDPAAPPRSTGLAAALGVRGGDRVVVTARDLQRPTIAIRVADAVVRDGWTFALAPYETRVWSDVREVRDPPAAWLDALAGGDAVEVDVAGESGVDVAPRPAAEHTVDPEALAALHAALIAWITAPGAAAWRAFLTALPEAFEPPPAAPLPAAARGAVAVTAAWLAAFVSLPDPAGLWRRCAARAALERALERIGERDAAAWGEIAEAFVAAWPIAWAEDAPPAAFAASPVARAAFGLAPAEGERIAPAAALRFAAVGFALAQAMGEGPQAERWKKAAEIRIAAADAPSSTLPPSAVPGDPAAPRKVEGVAVPARLRRPPPGRGRRKRR
jgi:glycosidase